MLLRREPRGHLNAFGRAHARATKLHHQKIAGFVQGVTQCGPFRRPSRAQGLHLDLQMDSRRRFLF
jgi:hypothetical protein